MSSYKHIKEEAITTTLLNSPSRDSPQNTSGPDGLKAIELERRFVQAGYLDRTQLKKLRRVPFHYFMDVDARNLCEKLVKAQPTLQGLFGPRGEELQPLNPDEMESAISAISDNYLMRESIKYAAQLAKAGRSSDISTVQTLLKSRPTAHGAQEAPLVSQIIPHLVSEVTGASGADSYPRLMGEHGRKITLAPGSITVIAGGPAAGKTAFAEDLVLELVRSGVPVVDYSLELQPNVKLARYCQHVAGETVGPEALFTGGYDAQLLQATLRDLAKLPLKIECSKMSIQDLSDSIRQEAEEGAKVVVIDFIQLVQDPRFETDYGRVSNAAMELYAIAKEVGVAMIWLAQLNREGRKPGVVPRKEDIEASGKIEQLAWTVLLLHPQDEFSRTPAGLPRPFKIIFDKVRLGSVATFEATYTGEKLEFDVNKTKMRKQSKKGLSLI